MKIRILSVIIFSAILTGRASGQSFEIAGADTTIVSMELNPVIPPGSNIYVRNSSSSFKNVKVLRQILSKPTQHISYFCWGPSCYGPNTNESPDIIPMDPEQVDSTFKGYLSPNGTSGISRVRYCFQDADNPSDQTCVVVSYFFGAMSVRPEGPAERSSAVEASYDSYNKTIHVVVSGGKIDVMNMLGQQVPLNFRYDGSGMTADASNLKTGYYFLFGKNEKGPWSARVVVNKQ